MQDKTIGIIMVLKTTYGTMKDYKEMADSVLGRAQNSSWYQPAR